MRTAQSWLAASLLCLAAGCSYDAISAPVTLQVDGVPSNALRIDATLTDSQARNTEVQPHFGTGVYTSTNPLVLSFAAPSSGAFTIKVLAYDVTDTQIGDATATGNFPAQAQLDVAMQNTGVPPGSYGTPCLAQTGGNTCNSGLVCKQYTASGLGICTHACTTVGDCAATPAPQAVCKPLPAAVAGSTSYCQWECDQGDGGTGGACPATTSCRATGTGTSYCEG